MKLGWCMDSFHAACRGQVESFHFENNKRVVTGTSTCECGCHATEKPQRKKGW